MEDLVKKAIMEATALKKAPDAVSWKPDEPWAQPLHLWSTNTNGWEPVTALARKTESTSGGIASIAVYSWNIDVMLPFGKERMDAALIHLQKLTKDQLSSAATSTAVVISFQECTPGDVATISEQQWVREMFYLSDVDHSNWASAAYGTVTLVDRRLAVSSCFRLHYSKTRMERDALFVDVVVPSKPSKTLRLCNTHLESLALEPQFRPYQMGLIAKHMHADDISASIVVGDFNAIQPADASLHSENDLKDAFLELGGDQEGDEGCTWGQQALPAQRAQFGLSRMDKVFFCGEGIRLQSFERFGADVVLDNKEQADQLLAFGFEKPWITDHLGVSVIFNIVGDYRL
ncbi:hypothetical protein S40293_08910 [Stachybotrys chartarum IBT 40293]|nr:hypothetical protein S40293_08910 [Stachybotrys chartarum IBT 40293]